MVVSELGKGGEAIRQVRGKLEATLKRQTQMGRGEQQEKDRREEASSLLMTQLAIFLPNFLFLTSIEPPFGLVLLLLQIKTKVANYNLQSKRLRDKTTTKSTA